MTLCGPLVQASGAVRLVRDSGPSYAIVVLSLRLLRASALRETKAAISSSATLRSAENKKGHTLACNILYVCIHPSCMILNSFLLSVLSPILSIHNCYTTTCIASVATDCAPHLGEQVHGQLLPLQQPQMLAPQ